jgi:hypothetical protein
MKANDNPNEASRGSQCKRILDYLKEGNSITPMKALKMFGTFRLGARIADLKDKGWDITTTMIRDEQTGKRYASYKITPGSEIPLFGEI